MKLLKPRRLKLAQTQEAFDAQVDKFLKDFDFPLDADHRKLFASLVQAAKQDSDVVDARAVAGAMRKAKANTFAFFVMYPERRPTNEADKAGEQGIQNAPSQVVPEAKG